MVTKNQLLILGGSEIKDLATSLGHNKWFTEKFVIKKQFFDDYRELIGKIRENMETSNPTKGDLLIFSLPLNSKIKNRKRSVITTTKPDGTITKHLEDFEPVSVTEFFDLAFEIQEILKNCQATTVWFDNHYYFPYCCENPAHKSEKIIGIQANRNQMMRDIMGGSNRLGPFVADHRDFLTGIISRRKIKVRKQYATLLQDNVYYTSEVRYRVTQKMIIFVKDRYTACQKVQFENIF